MAGSPFKLTVLGSNPRPNKLEITLTSSFWMAVKKSSKEPAKLEIELKINPM